MKPPKINSSSEYKRIAFLEGVSGERFYQLGQFIQSENAYVYSIDDTSYIPEGTKTFILRFTISVINSHGEVRDWYSTVNGSNISYMPNNQSMVQR